MNKSDLDFLYDLPNDSLYLRRNYIGSSDAPIIMGVSPWSSPEELLHRKIGLIANQFENGAMTRGKILEEEARKVLEEKYQVELPATRMFSDRWDWMMASMDCLSLDKTIGVEIKCPGKKDHKIASEGKVPAKYIPQLQHQMIVCGLDRMIYFSYDVSSQYVIEVEYDKIYAPFLMEKEQDFYNKLQNYEFEY